MKNLEKELEDALEKKTVRTLQITVQMFFIYKTRLSFLLFYGGGIRGFRRDIPNL